jgi:hypothetical protein
VDKLSLDRTACQFVLVAQLGVPSA